MLISEVCHLVADALIYYTYHIDNVIKINKIMLQHVNKMNTIS